MDALSQLVWAFSRMIDIVMIFFVSIYLYVILKDKLRNRSRRFPRIFR
jgi:hypothetical protein